MARITRGFFARCLFGPLVVALAVSLLGLPSAALAAASGTSPASAIGLSGTLTGTLAPGQTRWYWFTGDGSSAAGVTMDYAPSTDPSDAGVLFNVDWTTASGVQNADWPGYYRIGQGTPSGLAQGRRYWFTGKSEPTTYAVEVVNGAGQPIQFAIALTGSAFPPPALDLNATSTAPAAPPPAPPVAPTPAAAPAGLAPATDQSGLILTPTVTTGGPFSTINLRVDSSKLTQTRITRVQIRPPGGAVVDAVNPNQSVEENGVTWYSNTLVDQADPLFGYSVRVWGPANGAVLEVDWSTSNSSGALTTTVSGAPNPGPLTSFTP
jgi:hypothetical protein